MMLALCLIVASVCVVVALEHAVQPEYQLSEIVSKPKGQRVVRTYYYTRRMPPHQLQYDTRLQYPIKTPYRRPYAVYGTKPQHVEVPKSYVKVPQHYQLEKHIPYILEKPLQQSVSNSPFYIEHKVPSSLDSKIPVEVKTSPDSPVSITVEKQVLVPVNFDSQKSGDDKPSEIPSETFFSIPSEMTSQLGVTLKKESSLLPTFGKEMHSQHLQGAYSHEYINRDFLSKGKQNIVSIPSELAQSLSSQNKYVLEPIVVSDEPKKLTNVSEWIPRYEITDIKPVSNNPYKFVLPEKHKFDFSEFKLPSHESQIKEESFFYQKPEKNLFVPSPSAETITNEKNNPSAQKNYNEHIQKQIIALGTSNNAKNYQFYNLQTGAVLKPEALSSTIGYRQIEPDQKSTLEVPQQWVNGEERYKLIETSPEKWIRTENEYVSSIKSIKNRQKIEEPQSVINEQPKKWTHSQEQYIVQSEPIKTFINNHEQIVIRKEPSQHWLNSQEQATTQKNEFTPFRLQQNSKIEENEGIRIAYSSQQLSTTPHYELYSKETSQPKSKNEYQQTYNNDFKYSQPDDSNFKPLIPESSRVLQGQLTNENFNLASYPQLQSYLEQINSQQLQISTKQPQHTLSSQQAYYSQSTPQKEEKGSLLDQKPIYVPESSITVAKQNQEKQPASFISYQQFHPETEQTIRVQGAQREPQLSQQEETSIRYYQPQESAQFKPSSGLRQEMWHQRVQQDVVQERPEVAVTSEVSEDRGPYRYKHSEFFGQKRRQRQPEEQPIQTTTTISTTEEATTTSAPSSTTTHPRRKHRRKQRRRINQETTQATLQ